MMREEGYLPISNTYFLPSTGRLKKAYDFGEFYTVVPQNLNGKCELLADSRRKHVYKPDFDDAIKFIFNNSGRSMYRAFWNLDKGVASILNLSGDQDLIKNIYKGNLEPYEKFKFRYFPRRLFKISRGHNTVYYTDLSNLYFTSLSNACKIYLKKNKPEKLDLTLLETDESYWKEKLYDIFYYKENDAVLAKELGDFFLKKVRRVGYKLPRYFSSFASLTKQNFRYYCNIASLRHIPINILDIAESTYYAHRIELLKRGHFDQVYQYDLNSAYPDKIKDLPSLKWGNWIKVDTIPEREMLGFYKIIVDIPEDIGISPLPYRFKRSKLVAFPHGSFARWVTWYEADLLRDYIKKLIYGYEYREGYAEYKPFHDLVNYFYERKAYFKKRGEQLEYNITKTPLNAGYGTYYEKHENPDGSYTGGVMYNPVYATQIPSYVRWRLMKDVPEKDYEHLIGYHADSISSEKKLNIPVSNEMGDWSLEKQGEAVFISNGRYQIGSVVKHRGFEDRVFEIDWFNLLRANSKKLTIKMPLQHVITMKESLLRKNDASIVNELINDYSTMRINSDRKRAWERKFKNCKDLLENNISSKTIEITDWDLRDLK